MMIAPRRGRRPESCRRSDVVTVVIAIPTMVPPPLHRRWGEVAFFLSSSSFSCIYLLYRIERLNFCRLWFNQLFLGRTAAADPIWKRLFFLSFLFPIFIIPFFYPSSCVLSRHCGGLLLCFINNHFYMIDIYDAVHPPSPTVARNTCWLIESAQHLMYSCAKTSNPSAMRCDIKSYAIYTYICFWCIAFL